MGDDGRTMERDKRNERERAGRRGWANNAPRVWTQENRQLRPLPSPQPHFPHPSRALLRTSRRRRVRARELEDLERLYDLDVPHRLPGGLVAEIPEALCLEGAGRPRPSRACGGDEGARARDVTARARGVEGVHLATIRASMGVGDARWCSTNTSTGGPVPSSRRRRERSSEARTTTPCTHAFWNLGKREDAGKWKTGPPFEPGLGRRLRQRTGCERQTRTRNESRFPRGGEGRARASLRRA